MQIHPIWTSIHGGRMEGGIYPSGKPEGLSNWDIKEIKWLLASGVRPCVVARLFELSETQIMRLRPKGVPDGAA